jgi:hypothetical protein
MYIDRSGQQIVILTTAWWWRIRERLAVSKQTTHSIHTERFNFKKFKEVEGIEQYQLDEVSYINIIFKGSLILSVCIGMRQCWMGLYGLV